MTAATESYFAAQSPFNDWLDEACEVGPNYWEPPGRLFESWTRFAEAANEPPGTQRAFAARLESAGFVNGRLSSRGGRYWSGLRLRFETAGEPQH